MESAKTKIHLTQNELKIFAAASMLIDHIGAELLPQLRILRILGRLAFPLFAYFIFEGCHYTHSKGKYFANLFGLGLICVAVYYIYSGELYGNVLITFSLSCCIIFSIKYLREKIENGNTTDQIFASALTCVSVLVSCAICRLITVDYGFFGVMLPVFPEIFRSIPQNKLSPRIMSVTGLTVGLILLSFSLRGTQYFSLLTIPLLALYDGTRGKHRLKYFFYIFYPAHLLIIGLVSMLIG